MAGADTDTHQYLREWRKHRNKTLEKVAEAIGSKVNTISGWETGNRGINLDDLSRLAGVYEVHPADLLQSPEVYEQRRSAVGLSKIAEKLTLEQTAHLIWLVEEMTRATRAAGPEPPRLPFRIGGGAAEAPVKAKRWTGTAEVVRLSPRILA